MTHIHVGKKNTFALSVFVKQCGATSGHPRATPAGLNQMTGMCCDKDVTYVFRHLCMCSAGPEREAPCRAEAGPE